MFELQSSNDTGALTTLPQTDNNGIATFVQSINQYNPKGGQEIKPSTGTVEGGGFVLPEDRPFAPGGDNPLGTGGVERGVWRREQQEEAYAKEHLTGLEYEQYKHESTVMAWEKLNPFYKYDPKDFPMHQKIAEIKEAEQKQDAIDTVNMSNKLHLDRDEEMAKTIFDKPAMKAFDAETAKIEKFEKENPGVKVDMSDYPLHKRVEAAIAQAQGLPLILGDSSPILTGITAKEKPTWRDLELDFNDSVK